MADKRKTGRKMLKYTDKDGNVCEFPEPPQRDIVDLLDRETWGLDREPIYVPGFDDEDEQQEQQQQEEQEEEYGSDVELELVRIDDKARELSEEQMLEAAREEQRQVEDEERRRKVERVKAKMKIIEKRLAEEKFHTWNFPKDPDGWTEADLGEEWADAPPGAEGSGFDPEFFPEERGEFKTLVARERERKRTQEKQITKAIKKMKADAKHKEKGSAEKDKLKKEEEEQNPLRVFTQDEFEDDDEEPPKDERGFPKRPYYVPYRQHYPMIPRVHAEVECAPDVVDELEKMEEFLSWASYIFPDSSTYEGTVWDDLAHGKGVYTTPFGLCKYEGEWFQNMMQGHGVLYVNVPKYQPPPDSPEEQEMRAAGHIIKADYLSPEDREWLKKDIEDLSKNPDALVDVPQFEDDPLWIEYYGAIPEKGRYKYSGQWKHNRMHGCGVYEVNTRTIYGKFYFGELLPENEECTLENCALHSGLAQVAAAKAQMFVKKPDGMVREMDGPFTDPQHPYMYDEEDMWMAPGWVNEFHEVPEFWKGYVEDVDKEQQMWLNSFIKSPLRLPGPSELEYLWENGSEFVLLSHTPSLLSPLMEGIDESHPDCQGEILYHVPTGRLLNWFYDKDDNVQLFWQPWKEDGSVNPQEAELLPDGWDEFFSDEAAAEEEKQRMKESLEEQWKKEDEEDEEKLRAIEREREEMEKKWKEEDEEEEERQRLLEKIEEEERQAALEYAKRQQLLEEEEAAKRAKEEEEVKSKVVEEDQEVPVDEEEDETRKPSFGKVKTGSEEDDDDEEEDRKPRSFGTVAAGTGTPTALASLTLSLSSRLQFRPQQQKQRHAAGVGKQSELRNERAERPVAVTVSCVRSTTFIKLRSRATRRTTSVAAPRRAQAGTHFAAAEEQETWSRLDLLSLAIPV